MSEFRIRPYQLGDVDETYTAADESRAHIGRWMGWMTSEYSRKDAQSWVELAIAAWETGSAYEHVIVDGHDESIVGSCGLNCLNRKDLVCNLGYWVRVSRLGEGAAKQAALLLRNFGFRTLGFNRLEIVVAVGNSHSQRVAESVGAQYEGIQRRRLKVGEAVHDAHMYALINEEAKH
ncbi:MAG: GNAT family protein [Limisphaerales bacterium]